ncbi:type VII secretion-associated serine protease mycosin [Streptomyces sp. CA-210063]|uniref:type VII secretion-associated serine protease mycosin n=1 Tax=Streptomyces sp. CA-210063 TaxID=2801029 RepID=UPI00214CFB16|nr:type VII secretion-associated serine protease mycosin [Streptomyces sp. CA-210063]UUU30518.1 type VII secretion-associated serine protease mycosin [Streptomyces sp. CA-210063]
MSPKKTTLSAAAAFLTMLATAPPAVAAPDGHTRVGLDRGHARVRLDGSGECTFPAKQIKGTPWALQRVLLDELWQGTDKGKGIRVAVIDTGVDDKNPQLKTAVDKAAGRDFLSKGKDADPTNDQVGHGTKVAGIIAARPLDGTGFVGLAPNATIIPIRQNDADNSGDSDSMAEAITYAVSQGADVINISQDTTKPLSNTSKLATAVREALARDVVVVASAGNDGLDGKAKNTYPAAFQGVLAVASSDRNNERASFSQAGEFVGVAAPGVDIVSTVPDGGQCTDNGTSFSAPFVAGVAALLREKHKDWSTAQIVTQIEQTAERSVNGHDKFVGWGVVDPVRAVQESDLTDPPSSPTPDPGVSKAPAPDTARFSLAETPQERDERYATYTLGLTAALVTVIAGTAVVLRDLRRRRKDA